jgi:hypothetical protein
MEILVLCKLKILHVSFDNFFKFIRCVIIHHLIWITFTVFQDICFNIQDIGLNSTCGLTLVKWNQTDLALRWFFTVFFGFINNLLKLFLVKLLVSINSRVIFHICLIFFHDAFSDNFVGRI